MQKNRKKDNRTASRAKKPYAYLKGIAIFFIAVSLLFHAFLIQTPRFVGNAFVQAGMMEPDRSGNSPDDFGSLAENPFAEQDSLRESKLSSMLQNAPSDHSTAVQREITTGKNATNSDMNTKEIFLVKFMDSVSFDEIQSLISSYVYEIIGNSTQRIFSIEADSLDQLQTEFAGKVDCIEKDHLMQAQEIPNDYFFPDQWALTATKITDAWSVSTGSASVIVAVIDSGVDRTHPDLEAADILPGWDYIYNDAVLDDPLGHGTKSTGIIAATAGNGIGITGACWDVTIMPYAVFQKYEDNNWYASSIDVCAAIMDAADAGVDVINMSLGSTETPFTGNDILKSAVDYAALQGCIIVASAGNSGDSSKNYPASYEGVISVASIDSSLSISYFSNYNDAVDVAAPGENVLTTSCYATDYKYYESVRGTSFSAPYVSAIAALVRSYDDTIDTFAFHDMLEDTCIDAGSPGYDNHFGYGIIDAHGMMTYLQDTATSGDFTYHVVGTDAEIIGYSGLGEALTIPDTLDGFPVTGIGETAFANCTTLTSIVIPAHAAVIEDSAFENCTNLTAAYFMGNAPIVGDAVFGNCSGSFTIYYLEGSTGFTTPEWNTYPAAIFLAAHTVTFLDWDETVLDTQEIAITGSATAPEEPVRDDHTFIGWDVVFDNITDDLDVRAQYLENFTVTFLDFDGTTVLKTEEVPEGRAATAPVDDPVRDDHTFIGWDVAFDNIIGDLTVTAQYLENFTVTFLDFDGTTVLKTEEVPEGRAATAPADPVRDDHTFIGWDAAFDNISGDLTVTAQYLENFTVTFVDWDDITVIGTPQQVPFGYAATAPGAPSHEGYHFAGWDVAFDNITGDLTVTALYAINNYMVTFDSTGGSSVASVQADHGAFIAEPAAPTRTGYTFAGWYKTSSYETAWSFSVDAVMGDTTLYAKWVVIRGDITGDGKVDALDLLKIKKHLLGQIVINGDSTLAADVTGDGKIDALDLLKLKKFLLGQIVL